MSRVEEEEDDDDLPSWAQKAHTELSDALSGPSPNPSSSPVTTIEELEAELRVLRQQVSNLEDQRSAEETRTAETVDISRALQSQLTLREGALQIELLEQEEVKQTQLGELRNQLAQKEDMLQKQLHEQEGMHQQQLKEYHHQLARTDDGRLPAVTRRYKPTTFEIVDNKNVHNTLKRRTGDELFRKEAPPQQERVLER